MKKCIYCAKLKPEVEFVGPEHIWPQAIGVSTPPALFVTNEVCQKCNNLCGLHVDGAFLKSFKMTHERSNNLHSFLDPKTPNSVGPVFLGIENNFPCKEDEQCDWYAGAAGEHFLHVRKKSDPDWWSYVGGSPKKQERGGRLYIRLTADHPFWVITAAKSAKAFFPKVDRICLTQIDSDRDYFQKYWRNPKVTDPEMLKNEINYIRLSEKTKNLGVSIQIDFANRFLAKFALGVGYNVFGDVFLETNYSKTLKQFLWEREITARSRIPILGTGYSFGDNKTFGRGLSISGCWTIALNVVENSFIATIVHPSGHYSCVPICNDIALIHTGESRILKGQIYVVCPTLNYFSQAFDLQNFIVWKTGNTNITELDSLVAKRIPLADLPPKMAKEDQSLNV